MVRTLRRVVAHIPGAVSGMGFGQQPVVIWILNFDISFTASNLPPPTSYVFPNET
jgi:hypothetical protein